MSSYSGSTKGSGTKSSGRVSMIPIEGTDAQTAKQTFEQEILPAIKNLSGVKGSQLLHSSVSGRAVAVISWEDQLSQDRALESTEYQQRLQNFQMAAGSASPQEDFEVLAEA